jgi:hypothetical protein
LREQVTRQKARQKNPFLPAFQKAKKAVISRFLQLKCGHAAIGSYRKRFKNKPAKCRWCDESEDPTHALLRCRGWKEQRKRLIESLRERKIFLSRRLNKADTQRLFQKDAAEATLEFLAGTQIGAYEKVDSQEWLDTWDLQLLDPGGDGGGEREEQSNLGSP